MYGRTDLDQYVQMCKSLKNFTVLPQGGARARKGTRFVADINAQRDYLGSLSSPYRILEGGYTLPFKMIPFRASNGDRFLIFVTKNGFQYYDFQNPTAGPSSDGFLKVTALTKTIAVNGASGYTIDFGPELFNNGATYTSVNYGYGDSWDPDKISWGQFGDLLIICSPSSYPIFITRTVDVFGFPGGALTVSPSFGVIPQTGHPFQTSVIWDAAHYQAYPFLDERVDVSLTASGTTGAVTVTASAAYFSSDMESDVDGASTPNITRMGTILFIRHGSSYGLAVVLTVSSATSAQCVVLEALTSTGASDGFRECAWGGRQGYPQAVSFYQDRVWYGGPIDAFWASRQGDLLRLTADTTSTPAQGDVIPYSFPVGNGEVSDIRAITSLNDLFMCTSDAEVSLDELDESLALGVLNTRIVPQTFEGAYFTRPVRYESNFAFVSQNGRGIREAIFDIRQNSYRNTDLSYAASHMLQNTVRDMAFQKFEKTIWITAPVSQFDDNKLWGVTRNKEYDIVAWHEHTLGGTFANHEPAVFGMSTLINENNDYDDLYLAVGRSIAHAPSVDGSGLVMYLEVMEDHTQGDIRDIQGFYMDSSFTDFAGPGSTFAQFAPHLGGQTVSVMADGAYLGEYTLSNDGSLDITPDSGSTISVGYKYTKKVTILPLVSNALFGSGISQIKRVEEASFLFDRTVGAYVGIEENESSLLLLNFRDASVPANAPTPLFTGERTEKISASYRREQAIMIKHFDPLPITITAIVAKGVLYD